MMMMKELTGQTTCQIFTIGGSNDADSGKGVPFGALVTLQTISGVK